MNVVFTVEHFQVSVLYCVFWMSFAAPLVIYDSNHYWIQPDALSKAQKKLREPMVARQRVFALYSIEPSGKCIVDDYRKVINSACTSAYKYLCTLTLANTPL